MKPGWTEVALDDVCEVVMGQAPPGDSYNELGDGLPLVAGAGDFAGGGLAPKKYTTAPTKVSQPGDIVLSIRASIGARVRADGTYCLGRGVAGLRPGRDLDARYLWHWIDWSGPALAAKGKGATFLQVNRKDITEMKVPLPPLEEQKRIAAILDKADELLAKRRAAIAHLDSLTQAIFLDMFGDGTDWPSQSSSLSLGEIEDRRWIELGRGQVISRNDIAANPGGYPIYSSAALNNGEFGRYGKYMFDEEMITWSVDGGGAFFYRPRHRFSVTNVGGWIRILDASELSAVYLHAALSLLHSRLTFDWSQKAHSSVIRRVYAYVLVPKLSLQVEFARRVEAASVTAGRFYESADHLDDLARSLQARAFRGEL